MRRRPFRIFLSFSRINLYLLGVSGWFCRAPGWSESVLSGGRIPSLLAVRSWQRHSVSLPSPEIPLWHHESRLCPAPAASPGLSGPAHTCASASPLDAALACVPVGLQRPEHQQWRKPDGNFSGLSWVLRGPGNVTNVPWPNVMCCHHYVFQRQLSPPLSRLIPSPRAFPGNMGGGAMVETGGDPSCVREESISVEKWSTMDNRPPVLPPLIMLKIIKWENAPKRGPIKFLKHKNSSSYYIMSSFHRVTTVLSTLPATFHFILKTGLWGQFY